MLQYASPHEMASSLSTDDVYRVEPVRRPSLTSFVPEIDDRHQFRTDTSPVNYDQYVASYGLTAISQNDYGSWEAGPSSATLPQASYAQREALRASIGVSQINYSRYDTTPSAAPTAQATYGSNEALSSALPPYTVSGGDPDRRRNIRPRRTPPPRTPPVDTRQWVCCRCGYGPYVSSLHASCTLCCGHEKCIWCPREYI